MKWPEPAESGLLIDTVTRERLEFQVNPDQITDSKSAQYATASVPGRNYPVYHWVSGEARKIELKLVFHSREVKNRVAWLQSLIAPTYQDQTLVEAPHLVLLIVGALYPGLTCLVRSVNVRFHTLFSPVLEPRFSETLLTLEEFSI